MPRNLSPELDDHINGGVVTLATLVRIQRTDGVVMGFTNADREIVYGGVAYKPTSGISTTAVQQTAGTGVDNLDLLGALSDDRITESDLAAGRYDGAAITQLVVNRNDLSMGSMTVMAGYIGEVEVTDGQFRAEVISLAQRLKSVVGEATSATCRCRVLGDLQCKVSLGGNTTGGTAIRRTRTVVSAPDALTLNFGSGGAPDQIYRAGVVRFTTGANAGIARDIKDNVGDLLTLRMAFPFPVMAGDQATLTVGCDRTFAVCRDRFGNANNFHGEEKLPTNDKIAQTGRGG